MSADERPSVVTASRLRALAGWVGLMAVGLAIIYFWLDGFEALWSASALSDRLAALGVLGGAAIALLIAFAVLFPPVPTFPLTMTAGHVFGVYGGLFWSWTGAMLGAYGAFRIARRADTSPSARSAATGSYSA